VHHNLALAYEEKGQWDAAVASYQEAIRLKPDQAEAYYHIGVVYSIDEHRALADYYLYEAASLYLAQGNRNGALEAYGHLRSLKSPLAEKVHKRLYPQP
jgi:tetratricopeptide (TPR) repeat protein